MQKLQVQALGMTLGVVWGAATLLVGLTAVYFNYGNAFVELFSSIYIGFVPSVPGAIVGGIWGFVDAYIGGIIIAWLYNRFIQRS